MLFIRTDDLKPGMRLAKPIYNKLGVMLYDRDTRLTRQGIESIRNFELIGIYILEPAEPVPPLSDEDIAFEQFQTISMFQLRDCMDMIRDFPDLKIVFHCFSDSRTSFQRWSLRFCPSMAVLTTN